MTRAQSKHVVVGLAARRVSLMQRWRTRGHEAIPHIVLRRWLSAAIGAVAGRLGGPAPPPVRLLPRRACLRPPLAGRTSDCEAAVGFFDLLYPSGTFTCTIKAGNMMLRIRHFSMPSVTILNGQQLRRPAAQINYRRQLDAGRCKQTSLMPLPVSAATAEGLRRGHGAAAAHCCKPHRKAPSDVRRWQQRAVHSDVLTRRPVRGDET